MSAGSTTAAAATTPSFFLPFLLAGVASGAASALYLAYSYYPILLHGSVHAGIFASGFLAVTLYRRYRSRGLQKTAAKGRDCTGGIKWYLAGALPVHIALHFLVVGDLPQLLGTGVSHALLSLSMPLLLPLPSLNLP